MSTKDYSDKQEKMIASYLGWKQVTGSGSRPNYPGDVVSDEWLGECKTHVTPDHSILFKFDVWDKIEKEAESQFKFPALFVDDGSQTVEKTYVMIKTPGGMQGPEGPDCTKASSISFSVEELDRPRFLQRNESWYLVFSLSWFKQMMEM